MKVKIIITIFINYNHNNNNNLVLVTEELLDMLDKVINELILIESLEDDYNYMNMIEKISRIVIVIVIVIAIVLN